MQKRKMIYYARYTRDSNAEPFEIFGDDMVEVLSPTDLEIRDSILMLLGGEDISPQLYGHNSGKFCNVSKISNRDSRELALSQRAIELGIPMIGICRGAQMLCIAAGGSLYQHVDNHLSGHHDLITLDGHKVMSNTCHHQMMDVFQVPHVMEAWTSNLSSRHLSGVGDCNMQVGKEPEVVWFPTVQGLAIQGHPEWMSVKDEFVLYCHQLVRKYMFQ